MIRLNCECTYCGYQFELIVWDEDSQRDTSCLKCNDKNIKFTRYEKVDFYEEHA